MNKLIKNFQTVAVAIDVVLFTIDNNELKVLMIQMKKSPYTGMWAVPGGMVNPDESVDDAVKRHLWTKAGAKDLYVEQLYTFGRVNRDPFGRVVSVAYFALVSNNNKLNIKTSNEYSAIEWKSVNKLPKLAYDHREVVKLAVDRLQSKLEYTNIVYGLLPHEFTLAEMQSVYEIILSRELDKRNFIKKILSLGIVKKTGKKTVGGAHRPAALYQFIKKSPEVIKVL